MAGEDPAHDKPTGRISPVLPWPSCFPSRAVLLEIFFWTTDLRDTLMNPINPSPPKLRIYTQNRVCFQGISGPLGTALGGLGG